MLEQIGYIYAEMGGDDLTMTRTADVPIVLIDKDGNTMDTTGLEFDVDAITVTIPIYMMKEVPLYVQCIYGAGATEENTAIKIEPSTITISGDTEIVQRHKQDRFDNNRPNGFLTDTSGHLCYPAAERRRECDGHHAGGGQN